MLIILLSKKHSITFTFYEIFNSFFTSKFFIFFKLGNNILFAFIQESDKPLSLMFVIQKMIILQLQFNSFSFGIIKNFLKDPKCSIVIKIFAHKKSSYLTFTFRIWSSILTKYRPAFCTAILKFADSTRPFRSTRPCMSSNT